MTEYSVNSTGYVEAFIVWKIVDKDGKDDINAEYVYIDEFWKHDSIKFRTILRTFIEAMKKRVPDNKVKYIYWNRRKYDLDSNNSCLRIYNRQATERI